VIGKCQARRRKVNSQLNKLHHQLEKEKLVTAVWHRGAEENGIETEKDLVAVVGDHQDCVVEVVAVTTKKTWKKEMVILSMVPEVEAPAVDHALLTVLEEKHPAAEAVLVAVEEVNIKLKHLLVM